MVVEFAKCSKCINIGKINICKNCIDRNKFIVNKKRIKKEK